VRFDNLAVVDQQAGLSLNIFAEAAIPAGDFGHQIVQDQQRGGGDRASGQRRVGAGHRILHGVRKQQEQGEVERSHLADFPLAADADSDQHEEVDDSGAECDFKERVRVRGQHRCGRCRATAA
jgi:hypothetical protein